MASEKNPADSLPSPENFMKVFLPYVTELMNSKVKDAQDIYKFSTTYFETKLKEREKMKTNLNTSDKMKITPDISESKESSQTSDSKNISCEADFVYESVLKLQLDNLTVSYNQSKDKQYEKHVEPKYKVATSILTQRFENLNTTFDRLNFAFAHVLEDMTNLGMNSKQKDMLPENTLDKIIGRTEEYSRERKIEADALIDNEFLQDNGKRLKENEGCSALDRTENFAEKSKSEYIIGINNLVTELIYLIKKTLGHTKDESKKILNRSSPSKKTVLLNNIHSDLEHDIEEIKHGNKKALLSNKTLIQNLGKNLESKENEKDSATLHPKQIQALLDSYSENPRKKLTTSQKEKISQITSAFKTESGRSNQIKSKSNLDKCTKKKIITSPVKEKETLNLNEAFGKSSLADYKENEQIEVQEEDAASTSNNDNIQENCTSSARQYYASLKLQESETENLCKVKCSETISNSKNPPSQILCRYKHRYEQTTERTSIWKYLFTRYYC